MFSKQEEEFSYVTAAQEAALGYVTVRCSKLIINLSRGNLFSIIFQEITLKKNSDLQKNKYKPSEDAVNQRAIYINTDYGR